jgi:hypothetical protein
MWPQGLLIIISFESVLQFDRYDPLYEEKGKISEKDFGCILLTYAGYPDQKKSRMLKRVKKKYKEDPKVGSS